MKIINIISKHSKHNQVCFSSGRTNCDLHIKFENGSKVSLFFYYLIKSEAYVLMDCWRMGPYTAWYLTLCAAYLDEICICI